MRSVFVIFFCLLCAKTFAQETSVSGIIFDTDSKDRLSRVNIQNLTTGTSVYNNINGVFTIDATPGDKLVFKQAEHFADTVKIQSYIPLAIYLRRISIQLKQVNIFDTLMDPQKRMAQKKRDYNIIYGSIAGKDFLTLTPGAGVGLGIDAIYNSLSRRGRNAAHLRETIENDFRRDVVDYRFNRTMVGRITGLKGQELTDFMTQYRPGYYFLANVSEYEFITSIKTNLRRYLRNPGAHVQLPLYPTKK
jgi:hypothetical protein